jgi:hypothetical protein
LPTATISFLGDVPTRALALRESQQLERGEIAMFENPLSLCPFLLSLFSFPLSLSSFPLSLKGRGRLSADGVAYAINA